MSQSSLFAVLLRSPWWYSVLIGIVLIAISSIIVNGQYLALGVFAALPFFGIAGYAGYKQSQQPGKKRVLEVNEQARKMPAEQIAEKIAASYREARFDSSAFKGKAADLELSRGNRTLLLCARRFKVANTGIEPLKQLVAAGKKVEATGYLYVALGEISDAAREYARQNDIELIQAVELAAFFDGKVRIE
ncbi:MAG: restriction endonuclease [Granulosicoccus sp.]